MSYKTSLIKAAIKMAPIKLFLWVINLKLKGIAEIETVNFDIDARTLYAQTSLYGEAEAIEVAIENFAVLHSDNSYRFFIERAHSNKPWLNNLLAKVVGVEWAIPVPPEYEKQMALIAELFASKTAEKTAG